MNNGFRVQPYKGEERPGPNRAGGGAGRTPARPREAKETAAGIGSRAEVIAKYRTWWFSRTLWQPSTSYVGGIYSPD
jgi:hypothetical protein